MISLTPQNSVVSFNHTFSKMNLKYEKETLNLLYMAGLVPIPEEEAKTEDSKDFDRLSSSKQEETRQQALARIDDFVAQTQDPEQLTLLIDLLSKQLAANSNSENQAALEKLDLSTLTKLSSLSDKVAQHFIPYAANQLSSNDLQWLYLVLTSQQLIQKAPVGKTEVTLPNPQDPTFGLSMKLLALAQTDPKLQSQIQEGIKAALGQKVEKADSLILDLDILVDKLAKQQTQSDLYGSALMGLDLIRGHDVTLASKLKNLSEDELAWCLHILSTGEKPEGSVLNDSNELISRLAELTQTFSRDHMVEMLGNRLKRLGHQDTQEKISDFYDSAIEKLDTNSRKWLLLELTFKNFPEIPESGVTKPEGEQLELCQKLIKITYGCSNLWNNLHMGLMMKLGPELQSVVPYMAGIIYSIMAQLPDEARLWLAMSISTSTQQPVYDINESHYHEQLGHTALRQMLPPDIVSHFQFLAKSSPTMANILQSALAEKENDPQFHKKLQSLKLYEDFFVKQNLKRLDENAQLWLLYALVLNVPLTRAVALSSDLSILVPKDRMLGLANTILTQAHDSPSIRLAYVNALNGSVKEKALEALKKTTQRYVSMGLDKLTEEECAWLYVTLDKSQVDNHEVGFDTKLEYPKEKQPLVSKLLYLNSLYPDLKAFTKEKLLEKNPELAKLNTTALDQFANVSQKFLKPGELANLVNSSPEKAEKLAFLLIDQLPMPAKVWLGASLQKGVISTQSLLMCMLQFRMPPQEMLPVLMSMPDILLLCLKSPELKKKVVANFGGQDQEIQPLSGLQLDNIPLGDLGFAALCDVLLPQAKHLQMLSVSNCGLSDQALVSYYHTLYPNSDIKALNLTGNDITPAGYQYLLHHPGVYESPSQMVSIFSCLFQEISVPDVKSYLAVKYALSHGEQGAEKALEFYQPKELVGKFELADLLLQEAGDNKLAEGLVESFVKTTTPEVGNIQRVHTALKAQEEAYTQHTLATIADQISDPNLKQWVVDCLTSGKVSLPKVGTEDFQALFGERPEQSGLLILMEMSALLMASPLSSRNALYEKLQGEAPDTVLPVISECNFNGYVVPENLQNLLALGVQQNAHSLTGIHFSLMQLGSEALQTLLSGAKANENLETLDLAGNPLDDKALGTLCDVIQSQHNIHGLDLSQCELSKEQNEQLFNALKSTNVKELSLRNDANPTSQQQEEVQVGLTNQQVKALAELLGDKNCSLQKLDLSHNRIGILGIQYLTKALKGNPDSQLQHLCLSHNDLTKMSLKRLATELANNTTLKHLSLDGHTAKVEDLRVLLDLLKTNHSLLSLSCIPKDQEVADSTEFNELQHQIEELLERNRSLVQAASSEASLGLEETSSDTEENTVKDEDELDDVLAPSSPTLRFSPSPIQSSSEDSAHDSEDDELSSGVNPQSPPNANRKWAHTSI